MNYYLCAFGPSIRMSGKCASPEEAAKHCFGVVDRVTCLCIGGRSWKYASVGQKVAWESELKRLHKDRTGNDAG
jgi:hypothetical protein